MGNNTPVGSMRSSDPLDPGVIGETVDDHLGSVLPSAPDALVDDARTLLGKMSDRIRGQWLVVGAQTGSADIDIEDILPAATSVELVYGQAVANAQAAGFDTGALDRDQALLTSDYLHSLAYTAMGSVKSDPSVRQACFDSLSDASQRLASLWSRLEETRAEDSSAPDSVPIDPIVMATAGDLAGLLGGSDPDSRSALREAGAALGIARWRPDGQSPADDQTDVVAETMPGKWSAGDVVSVGDPDRLRGLLDPLPQSSATETLRSFATSRCPNAVEHRPNIHE
ncbi:Geranylgeranyl pyrophosphate synthase [Halorhabdus sp. SVX81]|uniref:hypothetical protein n=1 Tax=Halorhabdus sp. SVX81 TaxID=2978283 RepID=UPI0023DC8C83|nr:hypothetical protein [Halorhabdus sp. SVX81]WEL17828.1 Geranylgeranyl pyrophosphate synthase [Halorhabdus sp. SVX81]